MKLGIISDTHDNVENVLKAVKVFQEKNVELVLHCGDVVAPKTITFFEGVKLNVVKGNCDGDIEMLRKQLDAIGGEYLGESGDIAIAGRRILIYHGTDREKLDSFIKSERYRYVLTGHTHMLRDEQVGPTRVLNAGAHYYGTGGTVMLLDLVEDELEVVTLC